MKKVVPLALLCLGLVTLSCEEEKLSSEEAISSLEVVGGDTIDVYVGDTAYINVEYSPRTIPAPRLYCYGYNQLLMKAYQKEEGFMIIARKRGTTPIIIGDRDSEVSTNCLINILPATFNLAHTERELYVADTFTIKPILPPEIAKDIRWISSQPSVATISRNGMIRALSAGKCEISAVAYVNSDTLCSNKCHLTIRNMDISSLKLSDTLKNVMHQQSFRLKAICEPSNTTFTDYKWSSSDKKVATVDDSGLVIAVAPGSCVISVKDEISGLVATCNVNVAPVKMESLLLSDTKIEINLWEKRMLGVSFAPTNATYQEMHWASSNVGVAKVVNGEIEAVGVGNCIISVTNKENGLTAKCDVMVSEVKMTSLLLDKAACELELTKNLDLKAIFEPANPSFADLYWRSSDEKIATVDSNGNVVAVGIGTCTISVTNRDKSLTATCEITVTPLMVERLSLSSSSLILYKGLTSKLTCEVFPSNATNKDVKWESSDESVTMVSDDGIVTAVGEGNAMIKVTALDGSGCSAECVVKVVDEKYMKDYIENNISIIQTGYSITNNGISYTLTATNNGDTDVYLKEVRGYGSSSGTISINKKIAQGESYSGKFNTNSLDWVFEIGGVEYIKRN